MPDLLIVALGGAFGAVARFELSTRLQHRWGPGFPVGTLAVNVIGCLLLGALMAWVVDRPAYAPRVREFVAVGVLGSFTTFSTFGYETVEMARHGKLGGALSSVALNLVVGCAAVVVGRWLVHRTLLG